MGKCELCLSRVIEDPSFATVNAYLEIVLDRLVKFTEHVKFERTRIRKEQGYAQDNLF